MPRLPLSQLSQLPSDIQPTYARVTDDQSGLANTYRALFANPPVASKLADLNDLVGRVELEAWITWTVALTVVHERGSDNLWDSFEPLARQAGVSQAVIEGIKAGTAPRGLLPKEGIWVHFASEVMHNQVRDSTWQAVTHLVGDDGAVSLAFTACYYEMMVRFNSAFALDAS